jgi:hypothetical protein
MIKLFSLKQQKKDGESAPKTGNQKKPSAAQLRITKGGWTNSSRARNRRSAIAPVLHFHVHQCGKKFGSKCPAPNLSRDLKYNIPFQI